MRPDHLLLILALHLFIVLLSSALAENAATAPTFAELSPLKIRDLKLLLSKKGKQAACIACSQKSDFIERIIETHDWPEVKEEKDDDLVRAKRGNINFEDIGKDDDTLAMLKDSLKKLEEQGIDTSKIGVWDMNKDEKLAEVIKDFKRKEEEKEKQKAQMDGKETENGRKKIEEEVVSDGTDEL